MNIYDVIVEAITRHRVCVEAESEHDAAAAAIAEEGQLIETITVPPSVKRVNVIKEVQELVDDQQ